MAFPVYLGIGPVVLHPHWVFEMLGYLVGARLYASLRARGGDPLSSEQRWTIVAAAALGAALGSKLLFWVSEPGLAAWTEQNLLALVGGKSVLGALAGGLMAVEVTKRFARIAQSTGDVFAVPLAVGIGIGRIGCFLTGLDDHTHGLPASLPWAVDYGDGVARHPAQLYEIAFVWLAAVVLLVWRQRPHAEGDLFRGFLLAYATFRLGLEALKPGVPLFGLNAIQWVCVAVLAWYAVTWARGRQRLGAPTYG